MILCLGDKKNITIQAVYYQLQRLRQEIVWLDAAELIAGAVISDEIRNGDTQVNWTFDGHFVSPKNTVGTLNLLYHVPNSVCDDYHEDDRGYVRQEWESYLTFAINQFPNVINRPWACSLSGFCQSLPYQWTFVERNSDALTPEWSFSPLSHLSEYVRHSSNLIVTDNIYNTKYWIAGHDIVKWPEDKWLLFYQRPPGIPIIVTALDEYLWIKAVDSDMEGTKLDMQHVARVCCSCMHHFQLRLAQFLFFFDPNQQTVTFGSCNAGAQIQDIPPKQRDRFVETLGERLFSPEKQSDTSRFHSC